METVAEALGIADQALATLEELTARELTSAILRDAAKLDRKSPTTVCRGFMDAGLIDPHFVRQLLELGDDRNRTVHTYRRELAEQVAHRLPEHAKALRRLLDTMMQDPPL